MTRVEVLVVDDSPGTCEMVKTILDAQKPRFANVTIAHSGHEAWHQLDARPFDIVLSDYEMPGVKGLWLLAQARRRNPHGFRIFMSAYEDIPASATDFLLASPDALLHKPFEPRELVLLLRDFADGDPEVIARHRSEAYEVVAADLVPPPSRSHA